MANSDGQWRGPMCRTLKMPHGVLQVISGYESQGDELTKYSEGRVTDNYIQFPQKKDGFDRIPKLGFLGK